MSRASPNPSRASKVISAGMPPSVGSDPDPVAQKVRPLWMDEPARFESMTLSGCA